MPTKKVRLLFFITLQIATSLALPAKSFAAEPYWCPDLTVDNFVNFDDFAVFANNWRQSGSNLQGDLDYNNKIDLNDLHWFSIWWLNYCNNWPSGLCSDCKYPDCNIMNCTSPPSEGCPYCESPPPYIKVALTGNTGCGCQNGFDSYGLKCDGSADTTGTLDANYIVPYIGDSQWYGVYDINNIESYEYWEFDCTDLRQYDPGYWVTILVERDEEEIHINFTVYTGFMGQHNWDEKRVLAIGFDNTVSAEGAENCIEISINDSVTCEALPLIPNEGCSVPIWCAGGMATITIPHNRK
jgi:hypothetical protein